MSAAGFEDGRRVQEPRSAGGFQKLEKAGKEPPWPPEGTQPCPPTSDFHFQDCYHKKSGAF